MKDSTQPEPKIDAEMPWWPADRTPQADALAAAVHPQLAVLGETESTHPLVVRSFMNLQSDPSAPPLDDPPPQSWELISADLARRSAPEAVEEELSAPEAGTLETEAGMEQDEAETTKPDLETKPEAEAIKPEPEPEVEMEELAEEPASSRHGLRRLLAFIGTKIWSRPAEAPLRVTPLTISFQTSGDETVPAAPVAEGSSSEPKNEAREEAASAQPAPSETKFPELISEKELEQLRAQEESQTGKTSANAPRILPSRQGQYKSKR